MGWMNVFGKARGGSSIKHARSDQEILKDGTKEEKEEVMKAARKRLADRAKPSGALNRTTVK